MEDKAPAGLDFTELAKLISAELDSGLSTVNSVAPWSGRFHITSMRVQIGQLPAEQDEPEPLPDSNEPPARPLALLPHQRYQLADRGWLLGVEIAAGGAPAKIKVQDEPVAALPVEPRTSAATLFRELPVAAVRGVSTIWQQTLNDYNIVTVGDLIDLSYDVRHKLITATKKNYPLIIHSRVKQLRYAIPRIPESKADGMSLYSLVGEPPAGLRKQIGEQLISISAAEQLADFLALLYAVLDSRVLRSFTLLRLREISQGKAAYPAALLKVAGPAAVPPTP